MVSRRHLSAIVPLALFCLLMPDSVFAASGARAFAAFVQLHIISNAIYIFQPLSVAFLFYYGYKMIVDSDNDSALSDATKSFILVLIGFGIIALAGSIALSLQTNSFAPIFGSGGGFDQLLIFITTAAGGAFTLVLTISGMRLVASQGESGEADKLKKTMAMHIGGVILMMFSRAIVLAVTQKDTSYILDEIAGFVQFVLGIIGILSVLAMIAAGILLIVSVDEALKDRAKKTVTGTIITLVVVIASYSLIAFIFS